MSEIREWVVAACDNLSRLRTKYVGKTFSESVGAFELDLKDKELDMGSVVSFLCGSCS